MGTTNKVERVTDKNRLNKKEVLYEAEEDACPIVVFGNDSYYSTWPVSYTHLDVYKRQVQVCLDPS